MAEPASSVAAVAEAAVLDRFIAHLLAPPTDDPWERLFPAGAHVGARAVYFLLHRDPGGGPDAHGFVTTALGRILGQLACRSERELREYRGRVRGQISWSATLKSRHTGDYDPTRFVCREARRRFDTPENQLLRLTVEEIWRCLGAVPAEIRTGVCYYPADAHLERTTIGQRLDEMAVVLGRLRRHPRLAGVTVPDRVTPEHRIRARGSKLEEYGLVADLYERLHDATVASSWTGVVRLGRESLPLPDRLSETTEPWVRLAAAVHQSMAPRRGRRRRRPPLPVGT